MNICLICGASLSHHIGLVPITTYMYFTGWQKKRLPPKNTNKKKHITASILKLTYDQKPKNYFFWPCTCTATDNTAAGKNRKNVCCHYESQMSIIKKSYVVDFNRWKLWFFSAISREEKFWLLSEIQPYDFENPTLNFSSDFPPWLFYFI